MSGFNLGDYKEVSDRIPEFYQKYPEGRIASIGKPEVVTVGAKTFIGVTVGVWRTPDDPQPCVASAWEPFPGATSYTKDSEMMNAETSAWGRALVAAGILAKGEKIASRNEVRNRTAEKNAPTRETPRAGTEPAAPAEMAGSRADSTPAPSGAPSPASILERARPHVKPESNGYNPADAVCANCGKKEFIRPYQGSYFCSKRDGGCGFPPKGKKWEIVTYGEWLETHQEAMSL